MPHVEVIWVEGPGGNVAHLDEHGVTQAEAEEVLRDPIYINASRSTGKGCHDTPSGQ